MDAPELATYWDHRRYLSDWFDWKKSCNPRFSHRLFARLTGQSNPSLLLHVIQGKRNLTERTAEAYIEALSLSAEDAEDFRMLVHERTRANTAMVIRIGFTGPPWCTLNVAVTRRDWALSHQNPWRA